MTSRIYPPQVSTTIPAERQPQQEVECPGCSEAGGADMPVYHLPPICKTGQPQQDGFTASLNLEDGHDFRTDKEARQPQQDGAIPECHCCHYALPSHSHDCAIFLCEQLRRAEAALTQAREALGNAMFAGDAIKIIDAALAATQPEDVKEGEMTLTKAHLEVLLAMERGEYYALRSWGKRIITQSMVFPRSAPLGMKQCSDMERAGLIGSGINKPYRTGVEIPLFITDTGKRSLASTQPAPGTRKEGQ